MALVAARYQPGFLGRSRLGLNQPATLLTLPILLPPAYLFWLALQAQPGALWTTFQRLDLPGLLLGMLELSVGATLLALFLGVPWAWLVSRSDLPGRRLFRLLGPLPLAMPPYVGAIAYSALLAPGGLVHSWFSALPGASAAPTPFTAWFFSPAGAAFVLGCFSAPYVFIIAQSALERANPALEASAQALGLSPRAVFWSVTLPLLRPALLAGGFLVFLYAWVDFGVVSLLRVRTFTTVIYTQLLAGFSLPEAAASALTLLLMVWLLLLFQRRSLGDARYTQIGARASAALRDPPRHALGRWRYPALAYLMLVVSLTLALPLAVLLAQATRLEPRAVLGFVSTQGQYLRNTLLVAVVGASLAAAIALVSGWAQWRSGNGLPGAMLQTGYAIPGTVLGLSLVGLSLALFPNLYGTPALLAVAYLVLFAGPAHQGARAALSQVSPSMEEAARALGRTSFGAAREVVLPLAWPGLAGAWLLAFILSARELAATLLLRPAGFDTLAVRIWVHTMDVGADPRAALDALLLLALVGSSWLVVLLLRPRHDSVPLS